MKITPARKKQLVQGTLLVVGLVILGGILYYNPKALLRQRMVLHDGKLVQSSGSLRHLGDPMVLGLFLWAAAISWTIDRLAHLVMGFKVGRIGILGAGFYLVALIGLVVLTKFGFLPVALIAIAVIFIARLLTVPFTPMYAKKVVEPTKN